jgi:hypothetical protein
MCGERASLLAVQLPRLASTRDLEGDMGHVVEEELSRSMPLSRSFRHP